MKKHIIITLIAITILIAGCSKKNSTSGAPDPKPAALTFPAQNSACTAGTVISSTQSTITLTWNSASNTDSYKVDIKNLLTGTTTTQTSATNQLSVNLNRDTPYSWYVVSKSNSLATTAKSDVWKFYSAGIGTLSHPPFPADNLSPAFGQSVAAGTVNLTWTASDPDNDIASYDIYFGTTATPVSYKTRITDKFVNGVTVISGSTYYWRIITKDAAGNTSDSGVFSLASGRDGLFGMNQSR
ncbi:hypothetical protein BEL04_08265 [Mucilaginibacter sp. PPCGB 2223]|uniref:hypothetical protein n=1 Tax=Mucilaginibacter sp. PPCGB 2223 TaxID=1886027 RepID=UPI000825051E|nr:hypothetical protein [Mucilaginibacter sp. PPCGB 2223]OCX54241.1 hypothetical protein BEL04_08265 [Mucilaginibacter sp. PPCGB 2223]